MPLRFIVLIAVLLEGCAPTYSCKGFPKLAACKSATGAYKATQNPPADPEVPDASKEEISSSPNRNTQGFLAERRGGESMKIWMAPYEDASGDLVGSRVVLSEIEPRHWTLGGTKRAIPKRLAPLEAIDKRGDHASMSSTYRGGFPLFPSAKGPRRLDVEEVNYQEP